MVLTFEELRKIKHSLPTGSVSRIASELEIDEQTVRNYFGAKDFENGELQGVHIQPGPNGGIVSIEDTRIFELANKIIAEAPDISSDN